MRKNSVYLLLALLFTLLSCADRAAADPAPPLPHTASWLGNTYPGAQNWVQQDIKNLTVTPDGTVYAATDWDEAGREIGVYKNGKALHLAGHSHGWGYHGGTAVAVNDHYIYFAQAIENEGGGLKDATTWPPNGKNWFGVSRRQRADITQSAAFTGGKGGAGDTLRGAFLLVNEITSGDTSGGEIRGLCATNTRLFVSDPKNNQVRVYDAETMQFLTAWKMARPGLIARDAAGNLWILQTSDDKNSKQPSRVLSFTPDGKLRKWQITFPQSTVPTALAFDNKNRLLIADNGPEQNIKIYDGLTKAPKRISTFGEKGGIFAGPVPGRFGPKRFNSPTGVGADAAGNLYVASDGSTGGGGTVLESYAPSGKLNWRLIGLEFVDAAEADPDSDTDVFTKEERFSVDYARPRGSEASYAAYTVDRFRFPDDPRLHLWSAGAWVRRIAGRRYLFVNDMHAEWLQIYRFDVQKYGEIAVPLALFSKQTIPGKNGWPADQPASGGWLWQDKNGNGRFDANEYTPLGDVPGAQGWWVDAGGSIWLATEKSGIRRFAMDNKGKWPTWNAAAPTVFPHPAEFVEVKRLRYDAQTDTMVLGGTTSAHQNQHWKPMGPVICRYADYRKPTRKLRWQIVAPYAKGSSGHESCEPMGFDLAGDFLFVPYTGASKEIGFSTGHIEVFRRSDGASIGFFEPSADIGDIGLQDVRECLSAHRRKNGEYVVFLEEDWKAKILLFRWTPEKR